MRTTGAIVVAAMLLFFVIVERAGGVESREQSLTATEEIPLARLNFLVGVAEQGVLQENGTLCGRELETLLKAVARKEFWSLKVLNSFGSPPKSFSWGNFHWFAPKRQCSDLNTPYADAFSAEFRRNNKTNLLNVTSPFPVRLTMVYMRFSTPYFIDLRLPFEPFIHIGLCLPQSCSVAALQRYTDEYFRRGDFVMQRDFELQMQSVTARAPSFGLDFFHQTGTIITITILITLLLLTGLAEIVHCSKEKLKRQQQLHTKATFVPLTNNSVDKANVEVVEPTTVIAMKSSTMEELLLCFRLADNWRRALQPERENVLNVIGGVRSIICLWVSTFHVYYFSVFSQSNAPMMFAALTNFFNQPLLQAFYFVDLFFVLSGILLVYNFLSNESRLKTIRQNTFAQNAKLFGRLVLIRYLRITPMVIVTMLLTDVFYDFTNTYTPFYMGHNSGYYCKERWWLNFFYIQNFVNMNDICCCWTWYLACDMQFYIFTTTLLFLYAKHECFAKIVYVTCTLGLAAVGWLCNYINGIAFDIEVLHATLDVLYVKPWVRINPYLGGAFCGWLLYHHRQARQQRYHNQQIQQQQQQKQQEQEEDQHQQQQQQQQQKQHPQSESESESRPSQGHTQQQQQLLQHHHATAADSMASNNIGRWWHAAFWLLFTIVAAVASFMSYWRNTPTWLMAIIMSFGKLFFAICMGGGILMCAWGHGGPLNTLLSARPFRLLNKFCFSIYLLEPVIIMVIYGARNESTSFNEVGSVTDFIAINAMAMLASLLAYVLVESPVQRVCNKLLAKRS